MPRRIALAALFVFTLAATAVADPAARQAAEVQDILMLVESGVSEDVVVKHIRSSGFVYELTTEDILRLREQGVSDNVIEAMLDTALLQEPADVNLESQDRVVRNYDDDADAYFGISAGYFSPWYQYPYAWGFYYDPFPSCYSLYYYPPFAFHAGWGWYGNCGYYNAGYWPSYRWCDTSYWASACNSPRSCYVSVPRSENVSRWQAGQSMPSRRNALPARSRSVYDRRSVEALRSERLARSLDRERVNVRNRGQGTAVGTTAPRRSTDAVQARQPRRGDVQDASRRLNPRALRSAPRPTRQPQAAPPRSGAPTAAPRSAPRSDAAPRSTPRSDAAPRSTPRSAAPASGPRGGASAAAPRSGSMGRSGAGASMPRSR
jgi:hypothetical protein